MRTINLLPWREERRKELQKRFLIQLGGVAVLAAAVVLFAHLHIQGMIQGQEARNAFLQEEIRKADAKIREIQQLEAKKQMLLARMNVIQNLQSDRSDSVLLFDGLVRTLPDGLYFSRLQQQGRRITLEGIAESNSRVSDLMRRLDRDAVFSGPRLDVIQARTEQGERMRSFTLRVDQVASSNLRTAEIHTQ